MPIYARAHQTVDHVWSEDPAIDYPRVTGNPEDDEKSKKAFETAFAEYKRTGDAKRLPFKDGEQPVLFRLRSLTHAQKLAVGDALTAAMQRVVAIGNESVASNLLLYRPCSELVAVGLVDIVGMLNVDGSPLELEFEDGKKRVSRASMEKISHEALIIELGLRIREISSPDPTRGQA